MLRAQVSLKLVGLLIAALLASPARASDFAFLHTPPEAAAPGKDLVITGSITNAGQVRQARLRFRRIGTDRFEKTQMRSEGGDRYTAVIPGRFVRKPGVEYFVVIQDVLRQPHLIYASPDRPAQARIGVPGKEPDKPKPTPKPEVAPKPAEGEVNPFETAEEFELRTGKKRDDSGGDADTTVMPILPPVDDEGAAVLPGQDPDLLDEFAVFSAEDSTSLAASYSQKTSEAAAIISVVSRQRIEQMGARTLLDVLKALPGVETGKDVSGFDRVSMRGVRKDGEILLLVDGHRWNNFYNGRPYWAIPADIIERVEVIRGPGSALYGTSAFVGVVNVVTRETSGFWADAGFGSFLTPRAAAGGGFSAAGFNLHGAGDAGWTSGPQLRIQEDAASTTVLDREERDKFIQAWGFDTALALKADYAGDWMAGGKLYTRGQAAYELRGPYLGRFDTAGPDTTLSWLVLSLDLGYRHPILDTGSVDVRVYGDQHNIDQTWQLTPYGYSYPVTVEGQPQVQTFDSGVLSRTAYSANTLGTEARVDIPIVATNRLVVGSQLEFLFIPDGGFLLEVNRTADGRALGGLAAPDADQIPLEQNGQGRLAAGLYLQDEWQLLDPLFLTVGVRLSYFSDVDFDPLTHITPRAGLVWEIIDNLNLKLLYATAFRAPTFEESYDQTPLAFADFSPGVHLGNPELLPVFLQTGETALSYDFTFAGFRYRVGSNLFYTQIRKSIDAIDESGTQEPLQNSGGRDIIGAELDGRVEFTAGSYLYAAFGWVRSCHKVVTAEEEEAILAEEERFDIFPACQQPLAPPEGEEQATYSLLTEVPQYRLNIGANLEIGDLADLHLLTMFGGERRNNVRSTLESIRTYKIPAYALVNVNLRTKPIMDIFGFELTLLNALDFPYLDDVPRPDRVKGLLPREGVAAYASIYLQL